MSLGIECKYQRIRALLRTRLQAPFRISELAYSWNRGFFGAGFSPNIRAYLLSTGCAVDFKDVRKWIDSILDCNG